MPIHLNSIDAYTFEDMLGQLQPKVQQLEIIVRPGLRGETTRKTGIRGTPFQIATVHFVLDWEASRDALVAYLDLIEDGNPVEVIQHSLSYGYFKVLNVANVEARACFQTVGSIIANAEVRHVVAWTLLSTDPP